jgi:hypothetical protein
MACPLFVPTSPLGELVAIAAPLGDVYGGNCAADPLAVIEPEMLRRYCNFGYARGHCERAAQSDADAVRFMVRAERGGVVEIAWAVERNHHPVAVGVAQVGVNQVEIATDAIPVGDVLARQARACATAYRRHECVGQVARAGA